MPIIMRLDRVMADRKMSLKELSERVGVANVNLSKMKTGKISAIRFSTLEAICDVLDCQPGDILEYRREPEEQARGHSGIQTETGATSPDTGFHSILKETPCTQGMEEKNHENCRTALSHILCRTHVVRPLETEKPKYLHGRRMSAASGLRAAFHP